MKKLLFTVLLAFGLCFSPIRAFGIDASTLNDLSPTNTIYTSHQVDTIVDSHKWTWNSITNKPAVLTNSGTQYIYDNSPFSPGFNDQAQIRLQVTSSYSITNYPNAPGFTIDPATSTPYPFITYGLLGTYFKWVDWDEEVSYNYNYLFPTNHTTKYFALTDDPNGVVPAPDLSGYVPWTIDWAGNKSSVTIGINRSGRIGERSLAVGLNISALGANSRAEGWNVVASANNSHADGSYVRAAGLGSHALGQYAVTASSGDWQSGGTSHNYAFAWSGTGSSSDYYHSHGEGTFNIRPKPVSPSTDPASGFYIGESNLIQIVNALVDQRIAYAVENGITVNGTNYLLITENTLTNVFYNFHGHEF